MVKKRVNKQIEKKIKDYIDELKKDKLPIKQVILFGSHAKGSFRKWSDIDVCVISPKFKGRIDPMEYLWVRRTDHDAKNMIAPIGFHPKDFVGDDPLVSEIKRTGVRII